MEQMQSLKWAKLNEDGSVAELVESATLVPGSIGFVIDTERDYESMGKWPTGTVTMNVTLTKPLSMRTWALLTGQRDNRRVRTSRLNWGDDGYWFSESIWQWGILIAVVQYSDTSATILWQQDKQDSRKD